MPLRVLLIDDDDDDRLFFTEAFAAVSDPSLLTQYDNADDALKALLAGHINPDVIFLDLNMPRVSGYDFLMAVRNQEVMTRVTVIVLTTAWDEQSRTVTQKMGARYFVTKPTQPSELEDMLKSFLQGLEG